MGQWHREPEAGPPPDPVEAYFEKNEKRLTPKTKKTPTEIRKENQERAAKARDAKRLLVAQREIVRQKVELGQPITEEERNVLGRKFGNLHGKTQEQATIAAAAKLMIKPQSLAQLRLLVETTAAKHSYNPIEKLIELANSPNIEEKEKVAIHKALLPYLAPVLATPKATDSAGDGGGVKVVVTTFAFNSDKPKVAIHNDRPATVATEEQKPQ